MLSLGLPAEQQTAANKPPPLNRNAAIALGVVVLHAGLIWALQSGLLMRVVEIVVPVAVLSQFIEPPAPKVAPEPPAPKPAPSPAPVKKTVATPRAPAPQPLAIADPTPSPNAPAGVTTPQPALPPIAAPVAAAPAAPAAGAGAGAATVQLPSSDADYLQNPRPPYPPLSKRLNEQGKTTVRVLIGIDGLPQRSEIAKSSGFDRLDQAAMNTVMRWRYLPGKRGGVPEAMWFNVPINWVLE